MHTLKFDLDICTRCQDCADACFVDVIRWDEEKGIPFGAYPEDCQVCCVCERVCPVQAIEIIPDWESNYVPNPITTNRR